MLVADAFLQRRSLHRLIRRAAAPAAMAVLLVSPQALIPQRPPARLAMYAFAVPPPTATANPGSIQAGNSSMVTVNAHLDAPANQTYRMDVFRIDRAHDTESDLGPMTQTSRPGSQPEIYTAQIPLQENAAGVILLQVRARAQAAPTLMAMAARPSMNSALFTVQVTPASHTQGNNNGNNNGANAGAAAVGAALGGLLGGLISSHSGRKTPPGEPQETAVQAHGVEIRYPNGWTVDQNIISLGGPISVRNFAQFLQGAVVPPGGAEITVTQAAGAPSMGVAVQQDLGEVPQSRDRVADLDAVRVSYLDQYPNLTLQNVAVYVANGNVLYKFFLTFRQGEPAQQQYLETFNHVLSTAHFK